MVQSKRFGWWLVWLAVATALIALIVLSARSADPEQKARRMQKQIAQVRGLQFKRDVVIHEQSRDEFRKTAEGLLRGLSTPEQAQVLRTLGLLASDETLDADGVLQQVEGDGPLGAYDPSSDRMLVVKVPNPRQHTQALDDLYAREFYRALLDQHFDLATYLDRRPLGTALNNDEWLARRIVVESEAFYGAVLWRAKQQLGHIPKYFPIDQALDKHYQGGELMGMMNDPRVREKSGGRKPKRDPNGLPIFLSELLRSLQRDGVLFAHEVRERGWDQVTKLYTTAPPLSTEQILHPQKWFQGERPLTIQWPAFDTEPAFADWELVEQNVLGELMLRTVFRAHYLSPMMGGSPVGWNGDRFAVFKRRGSGDMLLLMYTAWDTERDATAFAEAYGVVMKEKYAEEPKPTRIVTEGRRVVMVEGGDESTLDAFMTFAQSAREIEDTTVER
jgi:hypothetical protein